MIIAPTVGSTTGEIDIHALRATSLRKIILGWIFHDALRKFRQDEFDLAEIEGLRNVDIGDRSHVYKDVSRLDHATPLALAVEVIDPALDTAERVISH